MKVFNGDLFINMLISASNNLENKKEDINKLNVFPVPDGDTGTNMSLTFSKATGEVCNMFSESLSDISQKLSSASLRGARGNSGVILSQFLRGLSKGFKDITEADTKIFANAFEEGKNSAYRAVMKPTEGTILTVMRGLSEKAMEVCGEETDILKFLESVIENGNKVLDETPELLPKLKQAGVVDAGGMGLMVIIEGMLHYIKTNEVIPLEDKKEASDDGETAAGQYVEDITFGYCTEFIIIKKHRGAEMLRDKLWKIGDSVVVVEDDDIIKVHVHTDNPDMAIGFGLKLGSLINLKIDNMRYQNEQLKKQEDERRKREKTKYGFVSVAAGDGFKSIYEELGIKGVISGGQSMNPSTDDILSMAEKINAETVFVFPNNKNIILAAEQAKELFDGEMVVIPTTSMAHVFPLMMLYDENSSKDDLERAFKEALKNIKTGQVTYAVRDSKVGDIDIKEGNIMELLEDKVVATADDRETAVLQVIEKMVNEDTEIVTVYAGEDISEDELNEMLKKAEEKFPEIDIVPYRGEQPIYFYVVSAE